MYNIAVVKFFDENGNEVSKDYEYRILDGQDVKEGMLGIVSWKHNQKINPSAVRIKSIKSAMDGNYNPEHLGEYAYLIGVVDDSMFNNMLERERKKKRLLILLKAEQKKLFDQLDLDKLLQYSPHLSEMIDEYKKL